MRLEPGERRQLAEDHRELLVLLAGARVRLAPGDRPTLLGSLALLDQAEAIRGLPPSRGALARSRRLLGPARRGRAGRPRPATRAETIPAAGARDHYLLAISHARQGGVDGYRRAIAELGEALDLQPRHYWSALQRGICRMELGEYCPGARRLRHLHRPVAGASLGLFQSGLRPGPHGPEGRRDRRLHRRPRPRPELRGRDLQPGPGPGGAPAIRGRRWTISTGRSAMGGAGDAAMVAGRGLALEGLGRHADADEAFGEAFAMAPESDPARVRLKWTYGFAVSARLPERARAAFDEVLRRDPRHPQALYGRAMLAMNGGDLALGLRFFDRALEADPGFIEARRYRAVLLSRRGDWDRATRDINWCLDREPRLRRDALRRRVRRGAVRPRPRPHRVPSTGRSTSWSGPGPSARG